MGDSGGAEVHLLDVIGSLASRLRDDDRVEARESLVLRTTVVPRGAWTLQDEGPRGHPFGAVVVDGLLQREVTVTGRTSLSLLGRGDVVLPRPAPGEALDARIGWGGPPPPPGGGARRAHRLAPRRAHPRGDPRRPPPAGPGAVARPRARDPRPRGRADGA